MGGYKQIAKQFNCTFRIGKYGIRLLPKAPTGVRNYKLFSIIPLDGWLFGDEMLEELRKRDYEL